MKREKESWTLLWVWNAFIPVHTFNKEEYVALFAFKETVKWLEKDLLELEEENKNLRDYADNLDSENDNQAIEIEELKKENKKLKSDLEECECSMHFENDEVWYRKRECKKLKEKVETLELWLDNKEKLNEEYRKQIDKYKRQYEHSMWEDDELIYEEWLYD